MSSNSRKTAFIVINVVMAVFTVLSAVTFCRVVTARLFDANEITDLRMDGTDVTPLIKIGAYHSVDRRNSRGVGDFPLMCV